MKKKQFRDDFERRRAERQRRIRKRRLIIFFICFIAVMLAVGITLSLTVFFPIENITAGGSKIYTGEQIIDACGVSQGDNLFTFTQKEIGEKIRKTLPYVKSINVKRRLPGSVEITVSDAAEYACYKINEKYFVADKTGFVLNEYDSVPENVFEIRANGVKCKVGSYAEYTDSETEKTVSQLIDTLVSSKIHINYIDVTDTLAVTAKVENRFVVQFGTVNNLDKKTAHLAGMIKKIDSQKTGKINLSMWTSSKTEGTFIESAVE